MTNENMKTITEALIKAIIQIIKDTEDKAEMIKKIEKLLDD